MRRIIFILLLQTLALMVMVGMRQWTLNTGTVILLQTQPVDPRSLFRGDYVHLAYAINQLRLGEVIDRRPFRSHETVYVALKPKARYWQPVSVYRQRPSALPGQVLIKGEVEPEFFLSTAGENKNSPQQNQTLRVKYGIEDYFVPEGEGRALQARSSGQNKVDLRIAVDRFGNAGIKAVLVNGKERYRETLF